MREQQWQEFGLRFRSLRDLSPVDVFSLSLDRDEFPNPHERMQYAVSAYVLALRERDFGLASRAALRASQTAIEAQASLDVITCWAQRSRDAEIEYTPPEFERSIGLIAIDLEPPEVLEA